MPVIVSSTMKKSVSQKKSLTIWQITIGEPIPSDGDRLHRAGQMCEWLSEAGHDVTFFNSTFYHQKRIQRFSKTTQFKITDKLTVVCLFARAYERSISPGRFLSHIDAAKSFKLWLKENNTAPDIIIASYPVAELCSVANDLGRRNSIPVIVDCRDFWPDIFVEVLPKKFRFLSKLIFLPFEMQLRKVLKQATVISGHTESAMNWGLRKAGRKAQFLDFHFPFTYPKTNVVLSNSEAHAEEKDSSSQCMVICFVGTLSHRSGLEKFIELIGRINKVLPGKMCLKIAGVGPYQKHLQELAHEHSSPVEFLGWLDYAKINLLMANSDFGLLPYDLQDFELSLPNKFVEYLSGGLPIISCTDGEVRKFIEQHNVGVWSHNDRHSIETALINLEQAKICLRSSHIKSVYETYFSPEHVYSKLESQLLKCTSQD